MSQNLLYCGYFQIKETGMFANLFRGMAYTEHTTLCIAGNNVKSTNNLAGSDPK
jgi:hypothetical protein